MGITDKPFAISGNWAIASDGIQWMLQRKKGDEWRGVSFVRSTRFVLARCMREKGVDRSSIDYLLSGLPDTFDEWKRMDDLLEVDAAGGEDARTCPIVQV